MALHLPSSSTTANPSSVSTSLRQWAAQHDRLHVDLGAGDGKYAVQLARREPAVGVIGLDTSLDHLRGAQKRHPPNVRFVNHDALAWPLGTIPPASTVTVNFPYGSLLRGLVEGDPGLLTRLDALLRPSSRLEIRVNETALIATGLEREGAPQAIVSALRQVSGLRISRRAMTQAELRAFPSSWAKRLGYGRPTSAFLVEGTRHRS